MIVPTFSRPLSLIAGLAMTGAPLMASAAGEMLAIDGEASLVGFRTDAVGGDIVGIFGAVDGLLLVDAQDGFLENVKITVDTTDVSTGSDFYDSKLRSEDFFDVDTYDSIKFESRGAMADPLDGGMLSGILTMRGVSLPVDVELDKATVFEDGYRVMGRTEINRYDFGMSAFSKMVDDIVEINVELVLRPVATTSSAF